MFNLLRHSCRASASIVYVKAWSRRPQVSNSSIGMVSSIKAAKANLEPECYIASDMENEHPASDDPSRHLPTVVSCSTETMGGYR